MKKLSCKRIVFKGTKYNSRCVKNCHLSTRVEPLVFVTGVWSSNLYEFHIAAPDSSNRVRGLDDLSNALVSEAVFSVRLPRQPHSLWRAKIA